MMDDGRAEPIDPGHPQGWAMNPKKVEHVKTTDVIMAGPGLV